MKQQQSGFTLIEIVAVIVLLGILAVTALPRFVNLQSDARIAALQGVAASLQGAWTQAYAKALIAGNVTSIDGDDFAVDMGPGIGLIELTFGYPEAEAEGAGNSAIDTMLDVDLAVFTVEPAGADMHIGYDSSGDGTVTDDGCYITYSQSGAVGSPPTIDSTNVGSC